MVYTVDSENGTDSSPWRGMTPVECIQSLFYYIQCVLRGSGCDKWFYQLPPESFRPPFAVVTNETMELYRQILSAFQNPNEPVTEPQLLRFYNSALVDTRLPFIAKHPTSDAPASWFVKPDLTNNQYHSVFLYSERLRLQALSQDALYPLDEVELYTDDGRRPPPRRNWFSAQGHDDSRTLTALDGIATLIKYIKNKGKFPCLKDWHFLCQHRECHGLMMRNVSRIPRAHGNT